MTTIREPRGNWATPELYPEREAIEAFLALPDEQRKVVRDVILAFVKAGSAPSTVKGSKGDK